MVLSVGDRDDRAAPGFLGEALPGRGSMAARCTFLRGHQFKAGLLRRNGGAAVGRERQLGVASPANTTMPNRSPFIGHQLGQCATGHFHAARKVLCQHAVAHVQGHVTSPLGLHLLHPGAH